MDEIVRHAMAKWPNVPAVFGWLALDTRGAWLIKNERITNARMVDFIQRNYAVDAHGRWFFQNGPQRVFVRLAYTPWVLRFHGGRLLTQTGLCVEELRDAWLDEDGVLVLRTEHGIGVADDRDVEDLAMRFTDSAGRRLGDDELLEALGRVPSGTPLDLVLPYGHARVTVGTIRRCDVPRRGGFARDPLPFPEDASR